MNTSWQASLPDFLQAARLGPISPGTTSDVVARALGAPDCTDTEGLMRGLELWQYGNLNITVDRTSHEVVLIALRTRQATPQLPPSLETIAAAITHPVDMTSFESLLAKWKVAYERDSDLTFGSQVVLVTAPNVACLFEESTDGTFVLDNISAILR